MSPNNFVHVLYVFVMICILFIFVLLPVICLYIYNSIDFILNYNYYVWTGVGDGENGSSADGWQVDFEKELSSFAR